MNNQINNFYSEFCNYVDNNKLLIIKSKYCELYYSNKKRLFKNKQVRKFLKDYKNLYKYVDQYNNDYIDKIIKQIPFDKVNGYDLDDNQKKILICDDENCLVIAGAGCGKTLTIVGKVNYLINNKKINPKEILCISFTNESCNSLKRKLKNDVEVMTFHKLALNLLNEYNFKITSISLDYIVDEYFNSIIYNDYNMIKKVLRLLKIKVKKDYLEKYNKILNSKQLSVLKKTIISFINLFKANNYDYSKFISIRNHRNIELLSIIIDIYYLYENELKSLGEIDFNDMISLATHHIINNKTNLKYKYIIIDEYQDTSLTRYKLIKAIKDKMGAKIIAVGDDWQSIYRFTGCNLDIFLKFEKYFGYTKKLYILNTYRNCQELINVAGRFIQRNKMQIKKELKSARYIDKPIKIIYERSNILEKVLDYLETNNIYNIMILGRNNCDINRYLTDNISLNNNIIAYKNKLNIRYLTIHKSKGLEEDCVIIINLRDDLLGIPSKIVTNGLIDSIANKSHYLYDEERRLFYVALTRTKNNVYLIVPKENPSIFVKELIKYSKKYIEYMDFKDF